MSCLQPENYARLSKSKIRNSFVRLLGVLGLLGIITSITLQLQRSSVLALLPFGDVPRASLDAIMDMFAEEEHGSDFMEAWLDGFAGGDQLGRGIITCATLIDSGEALPSKPLKSGTIPHLEKPFVSFAATLMRPMLMPSVRLANRANYWWGKQNHKTHGQRRGLFSYTYWPSAAFAAYHAMFPTGVETFQAYIPREHAAEIFKQVLRYSQQQDCMPIWCIIKQHKRDPFLLSYQVDGFSLELNYQRTHQGAHKLEQVLQHMIATVIEAGGKFYLAKDHFMTPASISPEHWRSGLLKPFLRSNNAMIPKCSSNQISIVVCSNHHPCKEKCFASLDIYEPCSNLYIHSCLLDLANTRNDRYVPANGHSFQESSSSSRSRLFGHLDWIAMGWHRLEFLTCLVIPISNDSSA